MTTAPKPHNAETETWLTTLVKRAKALDAIFACGGEVKLAAPLSLRGPKGKKLEVVERIGFRPSHVDKKLRAWCAPASFGEGTETRTDVRVREGRQLYARNGALAVEGFDEALREILCQIRESLCPHEAAPPIAELHSLNLYGRGGHFVAHKDTPREPGVFGTLVVCLPLHFRGGLLVVEQHESRATFDWETGSFLGSFLETETQRIRWAAFFGDVDHRIETVTSGCRATLTYALRRAPASEATVPREPGEAEAAFTAALTEALADPKFVSDGGTFGMPCLHLYAIPTRQETLPEIESLRDDLKGRDRLFAVALERLGLVPRVVPYVFETYAGESWRLLRDASAREKQMFAQKRLRGSILERKLPIEFHADWNQPDDVTWLVRPPWVIRYPAPSDGRPEPAVEFLGQPEYSATDYFGNEASDVSFYAAAAILFDVPPNSARTRVAGDERKPGSRGRSPVKEIARSSELHPRPEPCSGIIHTSISREVVLGDAERILQTDRTRKGKDVAPQPSPTDDADDLVELKAAALAEVALPADAHVIGEPVTVTQIRDPGLSRAGLLATCKRGDVAYELSLADVVFPAGSAGASLVARYRKWLGLTPFRALGVEVARPHKVGGDDIVVGNPVDLVVLACKSNALRCRLLGSAREVTLRTALFDEVPGSIITVTPKKQWTHARHPYLSGDVSAVRIDASVLGLVPFALHREDGPHDAEGHDATGDRRPAYRLAQPATTRDDTGAELLLAAQDRIDARDYIEADELLHKVLALDLRHLDAHAMLGERNVSTWPSLALRHFEMGVAIGSLTVSEDFDGVLPWGVVENRPFLRCLHGLSRALLRSDRADDAAAALRRLLRLDPADPLGARATLTAIEAGKTWCELEAAR